MTIKKGYRKAPCHGCKERYLGCHDHCEGYKAYKEDIEHTRTSKNEDSEYRAYMKERRKHK